MNTLDAIDKENGKPVLPLVHVGDSVQVHYLIREGDKERIQIFAGTVIALRGRGIQKNIVVRRIVQGEGVERVFPLHGPRVKDVKIARRGKVRRAKLYYLRDRVGKMTKVEELVGDRVKKEQTEEGVAEATTESDLLAAEERQAKPKHAEHTDKPAVQPAKV